MMRRALLAMKRAFFWILWALDGFPLLVSLCGCGRRHDRTAWERLAYVGVQGDDVEWIELRNCVCGSTIAVIICPECHHIPRIVRGESVCLPSTQGASSQ